MNTKHEQSVEKKALRDALLAIDNRMPNSSAEGREVAKEVLRRDRRRVRILTWMTMGFFLLTVIGICGSVYWYYIKVVPEMEKHQRDISFLQSQLNELEPQLTKPFPKASVAMTALVAAHQGHILYVILLITVGGIVALFALMLAAAFCTVLLIMATRRATLRQIQASLLALSEKFEALQPSLQSGQSSGGGQTTKESSG
jgi:predicted nucleic acid-binding Zn ribbon protein